MLVSLITKDATEEFLQVAVPTLARLAVKSHIEIVETVRYYFFLQSNYSQFCMGF